MISSSPSKTSRPRESPPLLPSQELEGEMRAEQPDAAERVGSARVQAARPSRRPRPGDAFLQPTAAVVVFVQEVRPRAGSCWSQADLCARSARGHKRQEFVLEGHGWLMLPAGLVCLHHRDSSLLLE